jgi:hypothetical protein
MNVEIGTEAAQYPEMEKNGILFAVHTWMRYVKGFFHSLSELGEYAEYSSPLRYAKNKIYIVFFLRYNM